MGNKLAQDSSATFKGIIYQFYEALDWCFELNDGQSLYFEKYGDIAISDSINIEVKQYKENLTDSHDNLWKTLSNWLKPPFDHSKYQKLLLITTQPIGPKSNLLDWNQKSITDRIGILKNILDKRHKISSLSESQKIIMQNIDNAGFLDLIEKFAIYDSSPGLTDKFERIVSSRAKHLGVLVKNREALIKALLGYMMTPNVIVQNGWSISEVDFSIELESLSDKFKSNSRVFPLKPDVNHLLERATGEELYIQKIKDIEYEETIDDAHSEYAEALTIIAEEFEQGIRSKNYEVFEQQVFNDFRKRYRNRVRNSECRVIDSQNFFDACQEQTPPDFIGYDYKPYKWFRDGVVHINMDDPSQNLKWKLIK